MRYKFPDPEDQASLAHTFQATTDKFSERPFLHFENEMWTYGHTNKAANTKNGQTEESLNESLEITFSVVFCLMFFGKVRRIPIAAIPPQSAKT